MTTQRITIDLAHTDAETAETWAKTLRTMLTASDRPHAVMVETIASPTAGALTPDPDKEEGPWKAKRLRPDSEFYFVEHQVSKAAYGTGEIMTLSQATKAARRLNRFPCTAGTCSHKHPKD